MSTRLHINRVFCCPQNILYKQMSIYYSSHLRRDVRAAEGARLESVCMFIAYRGFESLSLRQIVNTGTIPFIDHGGVIHFAVTEEI
jgi:hypothetical protein